MAFNSYMHERNIYRNQPDFTQIALDYPAFRKYAVPDSTGKKVHVDFSNPDALRMVTEILLKKDFNLDVEIPHGYLIPTVPQRLNYILWIEDLLNNFSQKKELIRGIDIGTGPCAIFSVLGARKNNWNFIATETSDDAIQWAKKNIVKNNLDNSITIVKVSSDTTLSEVLSSNEERYDFCLCNPPFFGNIEEIRKKHHHSKETIADIAQKEEILFDGGELNFVKNILNCSLMYKDRIGLFSSMFGKKRNFLQILKEVKELQDAKVTTTEFCQGNTIRWGIAWTFNETVEFEKVNRKIKPKKAKPPLEYQIPLKNSKDFDIRILLQSTKNFLESLLIPVTVTRSSQYFAELELKSDENTWCHQRRKRREIKRQKKEADDLEKDPSGTPLSKIEETAFDFKAVQEPEVFTSTNMKESMVSGDNNVVESNVHSDSSQEKEKVHDKMNEVYSKSIANTIDFVNSPAVSLKRKEFCHDDLSKNKKSKLDASSLNESSVYSKENTYLKLESSESGCKEKCTSATAGVFTKVESNIEENFEITSQVTPDICLSPQSNNNILSSNINETTSLIFPTNKCGKIDEACLENKTVSSSDTKTVGSSKTLQDKQNEAISAKSLSVDMTSELHSKGKVCNFRTQQGSVLHCHLQLIKGKDKVYVKMNCPLSADRNTMYQVFQLIKNKIK